MSKIKPVYIVLLLFVVVGAGIFFMKKAQQKKEAFEQAREMRLQEIKENAKQEALANAKARILPPDINGLYLSKDSCDFIMLYEGRWNNASEINKVEGEPGVAIYGSGRGSYEVNDYEKFTQENVHLVQFNFVITDSATYDVNPNIIKMDDLKPLDWNADSVSTVLECLCVDSIKNVLTNASILYTALKKYKGEFNSEHLQNAVKCNNSEELKKIQKTLLSSAK